MYSLYPHCMYAYTGSYIKYLYPRCLQQFTVGLVFDYLLARFMVHVHAGFNYHIRGYTKNKPA